MRPLSITSQFLQSLKNNQRYLTDAEQKRIHKYLHVEHYWPNATAEELFLLRAHNCMYHNYFYGPLNTFSPPVPLSSTCPNINSPLP